MEIQKVVEGKQQWEKLKSKELFNNLHAHLEPQVDVVEPPLVEVTSQPIPDDAFTTINTFNTPREITLLSIVASTSIFEERI